MLEWLADPTIWAGFITLVMLEIVLGIDNLIFIAILVDKLPPHQRDRARVVGLSLAMLMRLGLLAGISWLVTLTRPLVSVYGQEFSGRDLILFLGGVFLLFKGTSELHERLEGGSRETPGTKMYAGFAAVITQVVVLDAVFSLDAVITAVGMVDQLPVMMAAVIVAIGIMIVASRPLTVFVSAHPTLIILCLGFLLMIGFSLVAEGVGFHIPKGYLYAAIGFSLAIEALNQVAQFNRRRFLGGSRPLRERTADAVLRLLGGQPEPAVVGADVAAMAAPEGAAPVFEPVEREMIHSVLKLADRSIRGLMTPWRQIVWLDVDVSIAEIRALLDAEPYDRYLVARGGLHDIVGVVEARLLVTPVLTGETFDLESFPLDQPLFLSERSSALEAIEALRQHPVPMAVVLDERGAVEGLITASDLLSAIAGELAYVKGSEAPWVQVLGEGTWLLNGSLDLERLWELLGRRSFPQDGAGEGFHTLGGLVLAQLDHVPSVGEQFELGGYRFDVIEMEGNRVARVAVNRLVSPEPQS